ncbi:MAG: extensin family protein [Sulfitobacter sp.]|nr:extensin family protein [Sulfitobacter sp.]
MFLAFGGAALAEAPGASLRPEARAGVPLVQPVEVEPSGAIKATSDNLQRTEGRGGLLQSLRPLFRSPKVEKEARAQRRLREKGAVCGDIALQGEPVGRVSGRIGGCGVEDAIRLKSVSGVGLSQASVMDCHTARALKAWVEGSAKPALSGAGGGLKRLRVAAHYACRSRNNQKGAKISEHGKGRAIDISGFRLQNGSVVTVLEGWNARGTSQVLRRMHQQACGPFGTVLGPEANRWHRDHFHFDTARYRSGSYCR